MLQIKKVSQHFNKIIEANVYREHIHLLVSTAYFEKVYGEAGKGLIHIHHVVPISSIKAEYQIDYEKDLIPVCPNCHAMIHRKKEPYTIEEVRSMYIQNKKY